MSPVSHLSCSVVRPIVGPRGGATCRLMVIAAMAMLIAPAATLAQTFTYTYFPTNTTINTPVTTDFAIVGFSGGTYNEDDFSRNFTGPSSPTVGVADGADISDAEVFNQSIVNVNGGSAAMFLYDQSTLNVHGGAVPIALGFDSAVINVHAGSVSDIEGQCQRVNVFGGMIDVVSANTNTSYMGDSLGSCIIDVAGGTFTSEVNAFNDGILNMYGGRILAPFLRASEGGTINIYGTGLVAQLIDPNYGNGNSLYSLSGLLSDGSSLDGVQLVVRNDGVTYGHSTFNLITVPTPGAACFLGLSGLMATRRRR